MAMEPGPCIDIIKCIGPPICKYWNYHRKLKEYLNILERKKEDLKSRKEDIELRLSVQLHFGKITRKEVENCLKKAEKIIIESQNIEDEVSKINYLCRACFGKKVDGKIQEMIEVFNQGSFLDNLVIDAPSHSTITLLAPELVGETTVKEKIWAYLIGDSVCKIGVCGMGGIGKTTILRHIYNELLKETKFHKVIWVTISKEFDVVKVQKDIASALNEDLSKYDDKTIRAAMLSKMWKIEKRYVIILDDVWQRFSLAEVGIPEPTIDNGCKLVLTTRSVEVGRSMGCKVVKVYPLSESEALDLFLNNVGTDVLCIPTLKSTLELIVEQCAGLPLAIVTIANSMKGEYDIRMWINALNELKEHTASAQGITDEVFDCLKFSYDRLRDQKIQHCFLYCALYPEDFEIPRKELIEYWIVDGLIDEMKSRQAMYYKGHAILKRLENNCLLESAEGGTHVKMHDLVRDMALHITSVSPTYLVKAGMKLEELPEQQEWKENVEKVSLMRNDITKIPFDVALPKCRTLSTLLLQENRLETIHESFFMLMRELKILDLSKNSSIKELPGSISDLENLTALLLHGCSDLKHVPCLTKLRALKKLDLGYTSIEDVPEGLGKLASLTYLDLNVQGLKLPGGILLKLWRLQHLRLDSLLAKAEEVAELRKLETLGVLFNNLQDYHRYLSQRQQGCLNQYLIHAGGFSELMFLEEFTFYQYEKCVRFQELSTCGDSILLPTDIQELHINRCHDIRSLKY